MHTQSRLEARDAKRHIRELSTLCNSVDKPEWLRTIAKHQAAVYGYPQKVMLKAMARYIRNRNN